LHSFAGRPIDHPGIFEGLLRLPPIILNASSVFIYFFFLVSFYFLIMATLRPAGELEAWRLVLEACCLMLLKNFSQLAR